MSLKIQFDENLKIIDLNQNGQKLSVRMVFANVISLRHFEMFCLEDPKRFLRITGVKNDLAAALYEK